MKKQLIALALLTIATGYTTDVQAQSDKNKKSRYYQNSSAEPEFNVKGYEMGPRKNEVESKPVEAEYNVKVTENESTGKYKNEKRVIERQKRVVREEAREVEEEMEAPQRPRKVKTYQTTYGATRVYNDNRSNYDKYYDGGNVQVTRHQEPVEAPAPPPPPPPRTKAVKKTVVKEKEIKMTPKEVEYQTTVVKKRYTNLDVLCDDLDMAKIQRPVFKGICTECSHDVDLIIMNKNISSLEKNYRLKQCYMQRDKRIRETVDDDQYRKWLRIKDGDEYLILTKDPELKDGIYK